MKTVKDECYSSANTSFLIEYKSIKRIMIRKPLTEQSMVELMVRWKKFIFGLIDKSLIAMFEETLVLN